MFTGARNIASTSSGLILPIHSHLRSTKAFLELQADTMNSPTTVLQLMDSVMSRRTSRPPRFLNGQSRSNNLHFDERTCIKEVDVP